MKSNKSFFFSLWSMALTLCVVVSVFALLFAACAKGGDSGNQSGGFTVETAQPEQNVPEQTAPPADEPSPATEPPAPPAAATRLGQTPDAGREYLDKIIFLGDSTTYGIGHYYDKGYTDLCPPSQVWTPASGTLTLAYHEVATIVYPPTGEEISIVEAATRAQPEILMITLGVNGISFMSEEEFIESYTDLVHNIQAASPDTKIILNSMYPVANSYKYVKDINNDKIRAGNGWVERIAEDTGVRFLNSYEAIVGPNGALPEESQNGDGLHLTGETFGVVMNYIRTHAYQ